MSALDAAVDDGDLHARTGGAAPRPFAVDNARHARAQQSLASVRRERL